MEDSVLGAAGVNRLSCSDGLNESCLQVVQLRLKSVGLFSLANPSQLLSLETEGCQFTFELSLLIARRIPPYLMFNVCLHLSHSFTVASLVVRFSRCVVVLLLGVDVAHLVVDLSSQLPGGSDSESLLKLS